ncbi:AAA family ATPase [Hydrogenophaga pseudoflava]|uniref:AAA family ATPase n=1 Tax=Hydrogenophaga pseudoflava TaxID=47421 RepID=UPI0027E47FC0|nr:AAA family ATPase [Hydrogenophaga pseudoflava]MDQ7746265.1 AAA family ATPase [Hydrogenophaga pseudoflava]
MAVTKNLIKVRSLEFGTPAFRKLGNLTIEFADRLTLIAGHNGIGKSTIQGLVANTFGVAKGGPKSYFGEPFSANIERIVYLALEEVVTAQENPAAAPTVVAQVGGITVRKRCAMTQRTEWKRARVVPRTIERAEGDPVGPDAKVPLPTIFLGIKRLASIGEADEKEVASRKITMHPEDRQLMADFVSSVIIGTQVTTEVTHQSIKGSRKKTVQPGYATHDALAISMGQDSLGSIATALASFNRLQREQGNNYCGGLLVIDELDVGFHPHAIDRLVKALKTHAKRLDLQIIATTHSPRLIEAVHPQGGGNSKAPDKVVYLLDTRHPRLADDQSLQAILDDMALRQDIDVLPKAKKPVLGVYFEDPEGAQFCDALYPAAKRAALGKKLGVQIKLIPLGVGGSNLIGLPDKDPLFKDRVLIVDADTSIPQKAGARGNTIKLPCPRGAHGTDRSPENVLKKFLRAVMDASSGPLHEALRRLSVRNPSSDKVLSTFFADDSSTSTQREASKGWWVAHWNQLKRWGVIREWAICHSDEAGAFVKAFEEAVTKTASRII